MANTGQAHLSGQQNGYAMHNILTKGRVQGGVLGILLGTLIGLLLPLTL
jgi:hypothetical protein